MSFDQYFDNDKPEWLINDNEDDWYGIVEKALYAADLQCHLHRGDLELSLTKPLPMIPEDAAEDPIVVVPVRHPARRPSSVWSSEMDFSNWPNPHADELDLPSSHQGHALQHAGEDVIPRRPSSVYSTDFDSPESSESSALSYWASDICVIGKSTMGSLRKKPVERPSSETPSLSSGWSASVGRSSIERGSQLSSVYSYGNDAKISCGHTRNDSDSSTASFKRVRFGETVKLSFFDLSDGDDDGDGGEEGLDGSVSARPKSHSASKCLAAGRQLGRKALSLRIATSPKAARSHRKASSMPSSNTPAFSTWLFRPSLMDRIATSPVSPDTGSEGRLMAGAAQSAKARRILGLK